MDGNSAISKEEGSFQTAESPPVIIEAVREEQSTEQQQSRSKNNFQKTTKCLTFLLISILLSTALVTGLFLFHHRRFMGKALHHAKTYLDELAVQSPFLVYSLAFFVTLATVVLNIGFHTSLSVLFCLVIKSYFASVITLFAAFFVADLIMFFASEALLCNCLIRKIRESQIFQLLAERYQTAPYKGAFLTRFMMISPAIKNFILVLVGSKPGPYLASSAFFCSIYVNFVYLVSSDITEIGDLHKRHVSWKEMSAAQRIVLGATVAIVSLTVGLMLYLFFWIRAELKRRAQQPKEPDCFEPKETLKIQ